ncbi:hypothetical protein EWM64_g7540 [Hericium alpestre]|uniref:Uncharacterized protein n=1 Tax=Hericium alpestre TaxID=135208 RepID=A0A4Y9ZQG1_9AGAM|nr:hypothetical protein EWM64_g7540 [Hericium alpestre]
MHRAEYVDASAARADGDLSSIQQAAKLLQKRFSFAPPAYRGRLIRLEASKTHVYTAYASMYRAPEEHYAPWRVSWWERDVSAHITV